jgi:AraC family transcriptional regulator
MGPAYIPGHSAQGSFDMLRSFERLCKPANPDLLIAAHSGYAALTGSGRYAMPWHWHDCLMFILPIRGTLELKHEGRRTGTWLSHDRFAVVPPDRSHETRAGISDHRHLAIYVTGPVLERLDHELGSLSEFRRRMRTTALFRSTPTLRALQDLSTRAKEDGYGHSSIRRDLSSALIVQCIADVIAGDAASSTSHREHGSILIEDLKEYLVQNLEKDIPLDNLEARFGISRRHMTRLFRERTGLSIGQFQQQMRLRAACELLETTPLPIGEIAFRVGFDSGAALAHAMRRTDGQAPGEVRRRMARSSKK